MVLYRLGQRLAATRGSRSVDMLERYECGRSRQPGSAFWWAVENRPRVGIATAPAVGFEIGGEDELHRRGRDAEIAEIGRTRCHDIVALEQLDLIAGKDGARQPLKEERLKAGEREGDIDERPPPPDLAQHQLHQFLEGIDARPAELVDAAGRLVPIERR